MPADLDHGADYPQLRAVQIECVQAQACDFAPAQTGTGRGGDDRLIPVGDGGKQLAIGQQVTFNEYISLTQGCPPRGWTRDYLEHRADIARQALGSLGISWDEHAWTNLRAANEQLPTTEVSATIAEYAGKYESSIRLLVDTKAQFNLTIEDVEVDAYWSYWLDGAGHNTRLRINKRNASFSRVDAYRFALHEVLGHALQYSSLTAQAEATTVEWPRILAVHCPHQILFEGLAQVLPWMASPDDELICARTRIDHFMNLIRGQIHILINSGATAADCRDLVYADMFRFTLLGELHRRSRWHAGERPSGP